MAHNWEPAFTHGKYHRTIYGSFIPNGTGAISTTYGTGFTVARADVGEYTVTLDEPFADYVYLDASAQFATANADVHDVRIGDISIANRTFQIVHLESDDTTTDHPAAADIATSGTANKINFVAVVALESIPGSGV